MFRSFSRLTLPARAMVRGGLVAVALAGAVVLAPVAARAQDPGDLVVRLGRLENQMRDLSGRVEQLQFENKRLTEQLRKFQQDVDFRLQDKSGGSAPSPGGAPAPQRRGEAPAGVSPDERQQLGRLAGQGGGPSAAGGSYERAEAAFQQRDYAGAEMSFRQFLQASPRDARAADAVYWLGESYYQRQQYRDAAEQFLKLSTDYPSAAKGPDGLLKLGMSLARLNAKQQACATFSEVLRKYANASVDVRAAVERERRRAKC